MMASRRLLQVLSNVSCAELAVLKNRNILEPAIPPQLRTAAPAFELLQRTFNTSSIASYSQAQTSSRPAESTASGDADASASPKNDRQPGESESNGQGHGNEGEPNQEKDSAGRQKFDARGMFNNLAHEVHETMMPLKNIKSYTRRYSGPVAEAPTGPYTGTSDIQVVKPLETPWQKAWGSVQGKLGSVPFLSKLMGFKVADSAAYQKGQQLVEDLKEKYETSDHPVVHKVEEYKERMFAGSEASRAMQEIRARDPSFDMNIFLRAIKFDAPVVTTAFLKHDMNSLREHCGPEIMQRLEGLCKAFQEQELQEDPTILFVGEAEVVEVRLMDTDPFIICQFHCQQLKCVRDKFGNVVEGSPDTIHRVYYFWGLQQEKQGVVTADGVLLPPRWVIKDMLWQSMLALV